MQQKPKTVCRKMIIITILSVITISLLILPAVFATGGIGNGIQFGNGVQGGDTTPTPPPSTPITSSVNTSAQIMAALLVIVGIFGGLGIAIRSSNEEGQPSEGSLLNPIIGYVLCIAFLAIMALIFAGWGV